MAKASSTGNSNSARKRAVPPAEKSTRKKLGAQEAPVQEGLLDDDSRKNIIGVAIAIVALVLILIVAWPTNAVVTSFLSLALRRVFGIGAVKVSEKIDLVEKKMRQINEDGQLGEFIP